MTKRTPDEWHTLFAEHDASGLSAAAFCREDKLCSKYFSLRKKQLPDEPGFIKAQVAQSNNTIILRYGGCELRLDQSVPTIWLSALLKQLA